jgi:hypothetical protein
MLAANLFQYIRALPVSFDLFDPQVPPGEGVACAPGCVCPFGTVNAYPGESESPWYWGDVAMQVGQKVNSSVRVNAFLLTAMFLLVTASGVAATSLPNQEGSESQVVGPLEPLRSAVTGYFILAELVAHNERRSGALLEYTAVKRHQVIDSRGEVYAEEIAHIEYYPPDKKTFVVTSEKGWGPNGHFVLDQLIDGEIEATVGGDDRDSSITPANYKLDPLGEQQVGAFHCLVVQAVPKRKEKDLFEGKIWIDVQDYAIVRIEGHPVKRPSFWVAREDFLRQYQKVDGFWLPQKDETLVHVRFYGTKLLTVDHWNYVVNHAIESPSDAYTAHERPSGMCTVCGQRGSRGLRATDTNPKNVMSTRR